MFSLHIDTARTWRGGQNQVLLTVNGLREIGQRAALVAHPDGELRRRAAEGLELIPIAPLTEMDLSAGWRLVAPPQAAAAGRDPRARSPRRRDGRARASLDGRTRRPGAGHRRVAPRGLSPQEELALSLEEPAGRLLHRGVRGHSADAARATACRPSQAVTVHEGIDLEHVPARAAGERARDVLAPAPCAGGRQRRGARAAQGPAVPDRSGASRGAGRFPTRAS